MNHQKRPVARASTGADLPGVTQADCDNYNLLGFGAHHGGVYCTRSQVAALRALYGFDAPAGTDAIALAGDQRNVMRRAAPDGLRLVAWMAQYCRPGEDPVRVLVRLAAEGGYDVSPGDYEWAMGGCDDAAD